LQGIVYDNASPAVALPRAEQAVARALTIDPQLAEAHATKGLIAMHNNDSESARESMRRAIAIDPSLASAHMWLGRSHFVQGEYQRALAAYQRSQELDPVAPAVNMNFGMDLCQAGRVDDARRSFELMIDCEPDFANGWGTLAYCEAHGPRIGATIRAYRNAISLGLQNANLYGQLAVAYFGLGDYESAATWVDTSSPQVQASLFDQYDAEWGWLDSLTLAMAEIKVGDQDRAEKLLDESERFIADLRQRGMNTAGLYYVQASIEAMRDDIPAALDSLQRGFEAGMRNARWIGVDYRLESLHDSPEFAELLATMQTAVDAERIGMGSE
jgi:Tfp pilus assembly protein PilF